MADTLFIRPLTADLATVSWISLARGEVPNAEPLRGSLRDAAEAAAGHRVVVALPGTEITLTEAQIPSRNRQRILEAVPYALENQLAEDPERLHFAVSEQQGDDNGIGVAVLNKEQMSHWAEQLARAGLHPQTLCPDALCLPYDPKIWTGIVELDTASLRISQHQGFTVDSDNLATALNSALAEGGDVLPEVIELILCGSRPPEGVSEAELRELGITLKLTRAEPQDAIQLMAENCSGAVGINLLQGAFRPQVKILENLRPWMPAAVLGAILVGAGFIANLTELMSLREEQVELKGQMSTLYRDAFPDAQRVINPRAQLEQKLAELRGTDGAGVGFLEMFAPLSEVLKQEAGLVIEGFNYREGALDLRLNLRDLESLEHLKQAIAGRKLSVEIKSATAQGQTVSAHLRVSGGAS